MPLITKVVKKELPAAKILSGVNVDQAVALGAAENLKTLIGATSMELVPI